MEPQGVIPQMVTKNDIDPFTFNISNNRISVKLQLPPSTRQLQTFIYSICGKLINRSIITPQKGVLIISTRNIPKGTYILYITDRNNINVSSKFILHY
jgi:hypothetical protein